MKRNSKAATHTGMPIRRPAPAISASFSPVAFWVALMRSAYFFWSRNFSASTGSRWPPISSKLSSSRKAAMRSRALIGMWWSHFGQTWRCWSTSGA